MRSILSIHALELQIHLGVSASERQQAQRVELDIDLEFAEIPRVVMNDQVEDVLCYDQLTKRIKKELELQEFLHIERLAGAALSILQELDPKPKQVSVEVKKFTPPMDQKVEAVSFRIEKVAFE